MARRSGGLPRWRDELARVRGALQAAGLGTLNGDGTLTVPKYGTKIHIANIIFTDLPMEADG